MSLQIQHTAGPKALHYDNLPDRIAPQMTVVVIAASQTYIAVWYVQFQCTEMVWKPTEKTTCLLGGLKKCEDLPP